MAPTPSPAPSNQQFLSSVLSQRGPSSLPYSEDVKWLIRQHLVSLSDSFPSLQPETAIFTHNDGRTVNLLQATGTIPMIFHSVTYNIPIVIWLMESYPRHPPWVFVNPTRDMIIKRPHPHVNPSGLVSVPYLQNWIYPSSNLVDLARNLGHLFGRDPPLYSRRPNSSPNSNPNSSISTSASFGSSSVVSSSNTATPRPAIPPRVFHPPYGHSPVTEDPVEVYKRNAINKLVEMAHGDVIALRKTREAEIEGMFSAQAALRRREEDLFKGLDEMMGEKESLEQQLQMVLMNSDVLEGWLRENEGKTRSIGNVAVDNAFEPCDPLSKQMLECTSSDLAIEDVIYSLDKGVQEGLVPFDQYLRNVRLLSREQFFHRAISAKVRATQMHAHVTSMASRTTHYAA